MTVQEAIEQVRNRIDDTDYNEYPPEVIDDIKAKSKYQHDNTSLKFTDLQLLSEINFAVNAFNSDYTLDTLPQDKEFIVITRAVISCLRALATREARNYKISVDGISIAKADRVTNYLKIAEELEEGLTGILEGDGFAEIEVKDAKRYNVRSNKLT